MRKWWDRFCCTRQECRVPVGCGAFGAFAFALTILCGCSERESEAVKPRIVDPAAPLVFLTHPTDPPCSYTNEQGECLGTDVELARKIAAKLGCPLEIEFAEFEQLIPRLKEGTADLAIATITITEARARDVDFSKPYEMGGCCFLYRADGPKPRLSQVASLRIAAEAGTMEDLYLSRHGCDPARFAQMNEAMDALLRGKVDAIFFDATPLREWASRSNERLVVSPLVTREGYGVAVDKRRPDVLAAANAVIAEKGGAQ